MGIRPAGWYRVTDHHLQHRYWDGAAWGPLTPPHVTPRATAATSGYLAGRAVGFVVAGRGVDDDELNGPRRAAAAAGARTLLIAPQVGTVITLRGEVPVATHDVDATLGELDDREVDARRRTA
ncbi:hypothetical protein SAMN04488570_1090 [Nocardioides scoriae]|uniref:DUF2510 domain-containing protein n=1 Tax=Nocardioides scoriae TaxID=642780 RepID=A0A1H1PAR3_9ACTN|nr:hypothetical protein [Nocardioides scoriae]SDS08341.1 hypothetical protein SAMN04488570_1090 [Nocardioides scoriae]